MAAKRRRNPKQRQRYSGFRVLRNRGKNNIIIVANIRVKRVDRAIQDAHTERREESGAPYGTIGRPTPRQCTLLPSVPNTHTDSSVAVEESGEGVQEAKKSGSAERNGVVCPRERLSKMEMESSDGGDLAQQAVLLEMLHSNGNIAEARCASDCEKRSQNQFPRRRSQARQRPLKHKHKHQHKHQQETKRQPSMEEAQSIDQSISGRTPVPLHRARQRCFDPDTDSSCDRGRRRVRRTCCIDTSMDDDDDHGDHDAVLQLVREQLNREERGSSANKSASTSSLISQTEPTAADSARLLSMQSEAAASAASLKASTNTNTNIDTGTNIGTGTGSTYSTLRDIGVSSKTSKTTVTKEVTISTLAGDNSINSINSTNTSFVSDIGSSGSLNSNIDCSDDGRDDLLQTASGDTPNSIIYVPLRQDSVASSISGCASKTERQDNLQRTRLTRFRNQSSSTIDSQAHTRRSHSRSNTAKWIARNRSVQVGSGHDGRSHLVPAAIHNPSNDVDPIIEIQVPCALDDVREPAIVLSASDDPSLDCASSTRTMDLWLQNALQSAKPKRRRRDGRRASTMDDGYRDFLDLRSYRHTQRVEVMDRPEVNEDYMKFVITATRDVIAASLLLDAPHTIHEEEPTGRRVVTFACPSETETSHRRTLQEYERNVFHQVAVIESHREEDRSSVQEDDVATCAVGNDQRRSDKTFQQQSVQPVQSLPAIVADTHAKPEGKSTRHIHSKTKQLKQKKDDKKSKNAGVTEGDNIHSKTKKISRSSHSTESIKKVEKHSQSRPRARSNGKAASDPHSPTTASNRRPVVISPGAKHRLIASPRESYYDPDECTQTTTSETYINEDPFHESFQSYLSGTANQVHMSPGAYRFSPFISPMGRKRVVGKTQSRNRHGPSPSQLSSGSKTKDRLGNRKSFSGWTMDVPFAPGTKDHTARQHLPAVSSRSISTAGTNQSKARGKVKRTNRHASIVIAPAHTS